MKLVEIFDQQTWDEFQTAQPYAQFLQSWTWGEFRASQGSLVRRFALVAGSGAWQAALQMEYRKRKLGTGYWFAPRGPVFVKDSQLEERRELMRELVERLRALPELHARTVFWRFEPVSVLQTGRPQGALLPDLKLPSFCRTRAVNPASTLLLDLHQSLDDLQKGMHEKTRYNIRVAARHGVTVRIGETNADVKALLRLMDETTARDRFAQHSNDYLQATYTYLSARNMVRVRLAEWHGKILAANMEVNFGDTWTYLYGASSSEERHVKAPHAIQWDAIQYAKSEGYTYYDFWGINPSSKDQFSYKPSWEGITRFKRGWGGQEVNLIGTWDLPLRSILYRLIFWKQLFR